MRGLHQAESTITICWDKSYVFPVTSQRHLQNSPAEGKKKKKTDKEMQYLDRQIRKAELEIEILEHKHKC